MYKKREIPLWGALAICATVVLLKLALRIDEKEEPRQEDIVQVVPGL